MLYVLGYGDDMSLRGLQRHLPKKEILGRVTVRGWKRSFSHFGREHRYLTLVKEEGATAKHVAIFEVSPTELEIHARQEWGQKLTDLTAYVDPLPPGDDVKVYAFISIPPGEKNSIRRSYLDTVLEDLTPEQRKEVLAEIDFCGAKIDEKN
ncbi:MAG: gamma-glutamylcyclotransferase [Candidatus Wildermuthbacteria bacterium]|nr:gamma-glutamylcyclotransferase [Candidatus Wildermuthbacteria bacterium]